MELLRLKSGQLFTSRLFSQVQDLEFAQIERKVVEGLKVGNDCLKKMHEVGDGTFRSGASQALCQLSMS